jgi:hypothetical protein
MFLDQERVGRIGCGAGFGPGSVGGLRYRDELA